MRTLSVADQQEIEALFRAYGEAWARRDAKGCAALYASDGDAMAIDGAVLQSPRELEEYYERQLSGPYKDYTVSDVEFGQPRAVTADVAIQNVNWVLHGINGKDGGVRVQSTFVCRRDAEGWRYVAVRPMVPFEY